MAIKIYLLGQFSLRAGDRPVELPSRPAQSLLAYLALNAGMAHRREKLSGLLWPEATESNARSYLRQALWRIRKALTGASLDPESYLHASDIDVSFQQGADIWVDARAFLALDETSSLDDMIEVVALYRGPLLSGFYDEWIMPERDRLFAAYHQKMKMLIDALLAREQWQEAVQWSEQWIRLGHSPEPAYRSLMRAFAASGDQGMINVTYQRCVEAMERELDLQPSPQTWQLYEDLLRGRPGRTPSISTPERATAAEQPSFLDDRPQRQVEKPLFVARESELAELDRFLDLALEGQSHIVFVTGEAGSGKTSLIQEFTNYAMDGCDELIVAGGNCNAHTGLGDPYLPFREILEMLTADVEAQWAAGALSRDHALRLWSLLPLAAKALVECSADLVGTFISGPALLDRLTASLPPGARWFARLDEIIEQKKSISLAAASQQSDLFEQFTRMLQRLAREKPLVLLVDDLQWADMGSISLLFHLGRQLGGSRVLILGAYRPEEIALGRDGSQHPLESVIYELQRLFGAITINMDQAESRGFMEAIIDSQPNHLGRSFRQMLFQQTGGHPLFTIELLRGMQERGDLLQDDHGFWVEGQALDWETLPARVKAVIAQRIGRLPRPMRRALRAASVEGELFTAEIVARLLEIEESAMLEWLSSDLDRRHRLIRAQSITRMNGRLLSRYRFRHIQIQKYLYSSLDEVERVHFHDQIGTILEAFYLERENLAAVAPQLARHFLLAGRKQKAIHYLHLAGERSVQLYAYQEGLVHLNKALSLLLTLPAGPERDRQELELQLSLGRAWLVNIPSGQWKKTYTRARELSLQIGDSSQLLRILGELSIYHFVRSQHRQARELAEEAFSLSQEAKDPLIAALGHWYIGIALFTCADYTSALEHFQELKAFYRPSEHHRPFIHLRGSDPGLSALAYEVCCLWCLGHPETADRLSREVIALAEELDHLFSLIDALAYGGCMLNAMRRNGADLQAYAETIIAVAKEEFTDWLGTSITYLGDALVLQGDYAGGIEELHRGLGVSRPMYVHCFSAATLAFLAEAHAAEGRIERGLDALDEAVALIEKEGERHWEAEIHRLRGELLHMQGQDKKAEASFERALQSARRQQAKSWELRAAISLTRLWQQQDRHVEARQLLLPIYSWFSEGFDTPDLVAARELLNMLEPDSTLYTPD